MKSPWAALISALVIVFLPTGRAQDNSETEESADLPQEVGSIDEDTIITSTIAAPITETLIENTNSTLFEEEDKQLEFILMVLIPLILLALLLLSVVLLIINYKRKKTKQVPSSQGSQSALQTYELGSDNLKVPIFEEDTPSVMEIEMEELDKWMNNMNRNADSECLPTLKEEKESNHNPSDNES
ncbi:transmembrane protein 154 [Rhinolophus ferrumequinum]|uniref:Transmembrane protein 154 n=1 Tax=Rhinolophus ferrumequinum TaxID=59479 RepID=A0A671EFF7_RHIFE|nr:transmembrane protein 154 [Rhinolophus ferrumequinum]KAF6307305.1 transmembrane protein 154 [Rhinolophus ferrumequinum]